MTAPTVYLVIADSAIAFSESGELLETVEWKDKEPVWEEAAICDHRGAGGGTGFAFLHSSLVLAEDNARLCGFDVERVPDQPAEVF